MTTDTTQEQLSLTLNQELTDWFSPDQKPARVGPYKTKILRDMGDGDQDVTHGYSYWNGTAWGPQFDQVVYASVEPTVVMPDLPCWFRGLANEPEEDQL